MSSRNCTHNSHNCGRVEYPRNVIGPRCVAYAQALSISTTTTALVEWPEYINQCPVIETTSYALPRECITPGLRLAPGEPNSYIAVSYVWDQQTTWQSWHDRRTTSQALTIAQRLAHATELPLWIDAVCIPQDNKDVKMAELAKMADIYRSARAVLCLVPEVTTAVCEAVATANKVMDSDVYRALDSDGDVGGAFMFATAGQSLVLGNLFAGRWWERAWTFQEALLNPRTVLVGENYETVAIQDVLRIVGPVRRYAMPRLATLTLGRPITFWDSLAKMAISASGGRRLSLGDAMSCVWRRNASVPHDMVYSLLGVCGLSAQVQPEYARPIGDVLIQLFENAGQNGDYSWIIWCQDQTDKEDGLCMVPTPENVRAAPFMGFTKWGFGLPTDVDVKPGAERGVLVPFKSTGVVRWKSTPCSLIEMVDTLKQRGNLEGEIWDLLFGMRVGICRDINQVVGSTETSDISVPLLNSAVMMICGEMEMTESILDLKGEKTETLNLGFTNYAAMAAQTWKDRKLVAMSSQGGTIVVPENSATGSARIHVLPAGCSQKAANRPPKHGIRLAFVAHDSTRFHVSAIGIMIENENAGRGVWQLRKIG